MDSGVAWPLPLICAETNNLLKAISKVSRFSFHAYLAILSLLTIFSKDVLLPLFDFATQRLICTIQMLQDTILGIQGRIQACVLEFKQSSEDTILVSTPVLTPLSNSQFLPVEIVFEKHMLISTHEWSFHTVQKYGDSPVYCKDYQNIFRFSKYFKFQLCRSSHWLVVHKMGLLQQRSFYPNLRFWCKTYEWHHSWQEHTSKFWHRNGPHCIPHFSCKNNNPSGNQNSSKWFYLVLNPCTVLVYSL